MIGFDLSKDNEDKGDLDSTKPGQRKREVPPEKPGIEIQRPGPSVIPSPEPDQIKSIPEPEITPQPLEHPASDMAPEIGQSEIKEL